MILEGIVTTRNIDGATNIAPMGLVVDARMQQLELRPFQSSRTFANLERERVGVFHVVDDVLLLAQAAIGRIATPPALRSAKCIAGEVLVDACRWYEFEVRKIETADERATLTADVVHAGRIRDFFGFNRARHAVIEAAILATRVHLLPEDAVRRQFDALRSAVEKTGGDDERQAFALLEEFVGRSCPRA